MFRERSKFKLKRFKNIKWWLLADFFCVCDYIRSPKLTISSIYLEFNICWQDTKYFSCIPLVNDKYGICPSTYHFHRPECKLHEEI